MVPKNPLGIELPEWMLEDPNDAPPPVPLTEDDLKLLKELEEAEDE